MIGKPKNRKSTWSLLRRLALSLVAGAVFLLAVGAIVAAAISVSRRHISPEDIVTGYLHLWEPHWYNNSERAEVASDLVITQRQVGGDVNSTRLEFSYQLERDGEQSTCKGALLAQEYPDIFGGWRELGHLNFHCGTDYAYTPVEYTFWKSQPLEFPQRFYFFARGSHHRATRVEAILADGSSERADIVDKQFVLTIVKKAPFQIVKINLISENGDILRSHKL